MNCSYPISAAGTSPRFASSEEGFKTLKQYLISNYTTCLGPTFRSGSNGVISGAVGVVGGFQAPVEGGRGG